MNESRCALSAAAWKPATHMTYRGRAERGGGEREHQNHQTQNHHTAGPIELGWQVNLRNCSTFFSWREHD